MKPEPSDSPPDGRLDSWKEIAAHLRRDVRTVQRWEKFEGLPVHRLRHQQRGAVHAFTTELDAWWRQRSTREDSEPAAPAASRARHRWTVSAAAVAAIVALGWWGLEDRQDVAEVQVVGGRLVARSASGNERWSAPLDPGDGAALAGGGQYARGFVIEDLDGDGRSEVIAAIRSAGSRDTTSDTLYCFDGRGRRRWTRSVDDRLAFRSGEYGPPWRSVDLAVFRGPAGSRIAWIVNHDVWWPSILLTLDPEGRVDGRFVHAGWLGGIEPSRDRRQLVLSGVSNEGDGSVLVALDAARIAGHSPQTAGSRYECLDCQPGPPARYIRLPRSEGSRGAPLQSLMPGIQITPDRVIVRVDHDGAQGGSESIYEFSERLELIRASFSDAYWQRHRELEVEGILTHATPACPEREGPSAFAHANGVWMRLLPLADAATGLATVARTSEPQHTPSRREDR